jgi:hypothetical protein
MVISLAFFTLYAAVLILILFTLKIAGQPPFKVSKRSLKIAW